jgi:hypothetical protein
MKKVILGFFLTVVFFEILLRIFLEVPAVNLFEYNPDGSVFLRRSFSSDSGTDTYVNFRTLWKYRPERKDIPNFINITLDSDSLRVESAAAPKKDLNGAVLLMGDSVSLGWPFNYQDSHLGVLEKIASVPVVACASLSASPTHFESSLADRCAKNANWKAVVLQLTISDRFAFPDSLFLDSVGVDFQSKISYLSFTKGKTTFTDKEWFSMTEKDYQAVKEYSLWAFNQDNAIYNFSLARLMFFMFSYRPFRGEPAPLVALTQTMQGLDSKARMEKTLTSILHLRGMFKAPLKVYLHVSHPGAFAVAPRPEVDLLVSKLREQGIEVFDQRNDPDFQTIKGSYYIAQDLHPNKSGYSFYARKLAKFMGILK